MQNEKIDIAVQEARRFIERVEAMREHDNAMEPNRTTPRIWPNASAQSGAVRRASMELTRALAEMRKP